VEGIDGRSGLRFVGISVGARPETNDMYNRTANEQGVKQGKLGVEAARRTNSRL
jgi:hypothetical protein